MSCRVNLQKKDNGEGDAILFLVQLLPALNLRWGTLQQSPAPRHWGSPLPAVQCTSSLRPVLLAVTCGLAGRVDGRYLPGIGIRRDKVMTMS